MKHYARLRRTGDAAKTQRRGRKSDGLKSIAEALFPDWSERRRATWLQAQRRLQALAQFTGQPELKNAIENINRPNGSFSVSRLNRLSIERAALFLSTLPADRGEA